MLRVYEPPSPLTPEEQVELEQLKDRTHERLCEQCQEDEATGCVLFLGTWDRQKGRGLIRVAGKQYFAHRVAAWCYLGGFDLDDPDVSVIHTGCPEDTPACCAHEHLTVVRGGRQAVARLLAELGRTKGFRRRAAA